MKKSIVILMLLFVSGCATMHAGNCSGWRKIRPAITDVDKMSGDLARQLDAHNSFGKVQGCWTR